MTEAHPRQLAVALADGYTLSIQQVAERTTIGEQRIGRAIRGANGPRLGITCPILPAVRVRLPNAPPGYRVHPSDLDVWLREVWAPWPPPADPIDSAEALAILNAGTPLPAGTPEYQRASGRLAHMDVRRWRLLGQQRFSRAELEQCAAQQAESGISVECIPQAEKGRIHVAPGLIGTREIGVILGRLRQSGEPLDERTVVRWASEGLIPADKLHGRWWSTREAIEAIARAPSERKRGRVRVGCMANGCGEVMDRSWSEAYDVGEGGEITRRHVYCSVEHAAASRDQWQRPRGAQIMAPCTCILEDGSACGRLARVRTGREHQVTDEWVRCRECRRADRWPAEAGKQRRRPRTGRIAQSDTRKRAFAAVRDADESGGEIPVDLLWADEQRRRATEWAKNLVQSPTLLIKREEKRRGRELSEAERRGLTSRAKSRAGRGRAGRKPSPYGAEWVTELAELRDYHERRATDPHEPSVPSDRQLYLAVALLDYENHPERWGYKPSEAPSAALTRVQSAITKALQIATS